jgi:hypothetical protein
MGKKNKLIPKKIAGLKVPKKLRKSKMLRGLLSSAGGREILASALTAGAAAAAAALSRNRDDVQAGRGSKKGGGGLVSGALHDGAGAIMQVVASAARSVLPDQPAPSAPAKAKAASSEQRTDKPAREEPRH